MTSFKAKTINLLLRNRHLFQGRLHKETYDFNTSIQGFRDQCERGATRFGKIPESVTIKADNIEGINAEWIYPAGYDPAKIIMYVHGGGYVSGSCNDHRPIVSKFARTCGFANLTYEYRLAPEHPYPAAVDDSVVVYQHLLKSGFLPGNIIITGESAGGGLTLALLLALKDAGIELPAAAVALSPWTDLTCSGESYKTRNKFSLAPLNSWFVFSKYYAGENDPTLPFVSPLFGNHEGLPPILIISGEDDELYDDGEQFYKRALAKGVDISFKGGKDMVHCYPLLAPAFSEATEAMNEICAFINKHFNKHLN